MNTYKVDIHEKRFNSIIAQDRIEANSAQEAKDIVTEKCKNTILYVGTAQKLIK